MTNSADHGTMDLGSRPTSVITQNGTVLSAAGTSGSPRWRPGERLEHLFEARCDALGDEARFRLAVDAPGASVSYAELDARANRLARCLSRRGAIEAGDRVAILFDDPLHGYVAMLAVLKLHAAYVPMDVAFPPGRLAFIAADAGTRLVLTDAHLVSSLRSLPTDIEVLSANMLTPTINAQSSDRLTLAETGPLVDELCYVIYTSGTTGQPKGVAISHASICNFVRVAAESYGLAANDRVYQGLTIAFDFAVEEIWLAWMMGATLVPRPPGASLLGRDLHTFLTEQRVTALCCVPTLLGTLPADLPALRFLLVSGEACPPDLMARWHRPERRMLNVYGPTEATVTATWTVLDPSQPVTIGVPLPTYSIVILDPDHDRVLDVHESGEIAIAGIGLADGYLGLPERTAQAFVPDFLGLADNPSGRLYRTGDIGWVNARGELQHGGRIDEQVKIRGHRIELAEIEALIRLEPGVEQAVVATFAAQPGLEELAAFYTQSPQAAEVDVDEVFARLRHQLPAYMVPMSLERLPALPLMPSGKIDRRGLPKPTSQRRILSRAPYVAPASELEAVLARELAALLGLAQVSVNSHIFEELGASSLLMARYTTVLESCGDRLETVSIRDVYLHPTVRRLARALSDRSCPEATTDESLPLPPPVGTPRYRLCGALQLLALLGYVVLGGVGFDLGSSWMSAAHGVIEIYVRAVALGAASLTALGLAPFVAKWTLIGRFTPQRVRLWSFTYVRFWIVKTLLVTDPLGRLLVGTPLYRLYLRALGAQVGAGTAILTHHPPIATDLLSLGAGCVVRKESWLNGYRVRDGVLEIGPVTVGRHSIIGEQSVLDIFAEVGDGARLDHASSLQAGQRIPDGAHWGGSPAQPSLAPVQTPAPMPAVRFRIGAYVYGVAKLALALVTAEPLVVVIAALLVGHSSWIHGITECDVLFGAAVITMTVPLLSLAVAVMIPRSASRFLEPERSYPLYGWHWAMQRVVARASNVPMLTALLGDSSAIVGYLQLLGYCLGTVRQTGSNFGLQVKHEMPTLNSIGTGTLVSDGLSMGNLEVSPGTFRVRAVRIGKRCFLGNAIAYPAGARVGDNCLLATKVMVPTDGPLREGVGLLGSPSFEIPRSVRRDSTLAVLGTDDPQRPAQLAAKLRHNLATMGLFLSVRWLCLAAALSIALLPFASTGWTAWLGTGASAVLDVIATGTVFVAAERILTRGRRPPPALCSIYDQAFWRHERYWKVPAPGFLRIFDGTPLKGPAWRLLGVRVGPGLYDDGATIVERTLVEIGSNCTLNAATTLQSHSLEDGVFKSARIQIGNAVTLGTNAYIHYGVVVSDGATLEADAFLMKGSQLPPGSRWVGNPAIQLRATRSPFQSPEGAR